MLEINRVNIKYYDDNMMYIFYEYEIYLRFWLNSLMIVNISKKEINNIDIDKKAVFIFYIKKSVYFKYNILFLEKYVYKIF